MMLSPLTIAYYSTVVLMRRYYGLKNSIEPKLDKPIIEKERYLCLNIIAFLFRDLRPICLAMLYYNDNNVPQKCYVCLPELK